MSILERINPLDFPIIWDSICSNLDTTDTAALKFCSTDFYKAINPKYNICVYCRKGSNNDKLTCIPCIIACNSCGDLLLNTVCTNCIKTQKLQEIVENGKYDRYLFCDTCHIFQGTNWP